MWDLRTTKLLRSVPLLDGTDPLFNGDGTVLFASLRRGAQVSSLSDPKSSLGDAESSLGDPKSSLGDAESSLGDAESSVG